MKLFLENALSTKIRYQILVGWSVLALLLSFSAEYLWNIAPCKLCLAQRGLYFVLLMFGLAKLLSNMKWAEKTCFLAILALVCLSSFHALIQLGIIEDRCQNKIEMGDELSLKAMLEKSEACSNISWKFLAMPASIWNATIGSIFLVFFIKGQKTKAINL